MIQGYRGQQLNSLQQSLPCRERWNQVPLVSLEGEELDAVLAHRCITHHFVRRGSGALRFPQGSQLLVGLEGWQARPLSASFPKPSQRDIQKTEYFVQVDKQDGLYGRNVLIVEGLKETSHLTRIGHVSSSQLGLVSHLPKLLSDSG
ncbi:hypothetical protein D9M70_531350 [compost metagenome]